MTDDADDDDDDQSDQRVFPGSDLAENLLRAGRDDR